jgi:hypothetical protein
LVRALFSRDSRASLFAVALAFYLTEDWLHTGGIHNLILVKAATISRIETCYAYSLPVRSMTGRCLDLILCHDGSGNVLMFSLVSTAEKVFAVASHGLRTGLPPTPSSI